MFVAVTFIGGIIVRIAALFLALAVWVGVPLSAAPAASAAASITAPSVPEVSGVGAVRTVAASRPRPKRKSGSRTGTGAKRRHGERPGTGDYVAGAAVSWWVYATYGLGGLAVLIVVGLLVLLLLRRRQARTD